MNAILQVENLTKQYADFKLDHVSFSVPKGTIMGLIGENGAGKSTTINAILDLIHKDDGTVTFWGQELSSTKQIKEDVGVVFDGINFYETLTPAKVGKIAGAAYKQWDGHLFQDYLKRFQLPADKEIKSLSKGMKMKLCIAVALSHNPKLLILDEATSGLDPVMRDDILDVFLEFVQDENHSILMSSHITTDLEIILSIRARFFFVKRKMNFVITMVLSAVAQHCSTSSIKRKFWLTAKMIINGMCW